DAASARIVVLSPDLKFVREFGREGRGPGELQRLPFYRANPPPKNMLSVADAVLAVYDGVTVHAFAVNGSFAGYESGFPRGSASCRYTPRSRRAGVRDRYPGTAKPGASDVARYR